MPETEAGRSLGSAIKARRLELGWSQEELAERVAAHGDPAFRQSDVSRLERGKVGLPHRDRLARIAAVLDLTPGELLARSGWAGAEAAFSAGGQATDRAVPAEADVAAVLDVQAGPAFFSTPGLAPVEESPVNLSSVIAEAVATRARAQQILMRSEALREAYERAGRVERPTQAAPRGAVDA